MTIYKIKFKRTKDSEWENGITIESSEQAGDLVLDVKGNSIYSYFDVKRLHYDFCIDLTPILDDKELKQWCMDNQPYYKKHIPEVFNYFKNKL